MLLMQLTKQHCLTSVIHEIMRSRRRLLRISKQLVTLTLMFVLVQSMEYSFGRQSLHWKMQKLLGLIKWSLYGGRKHKYGLNCQAVCDVRGRFLNMSIICDGASSDLVAFEGSGLKKGLDVGFLAPNLCLLVTMHTSIHSTWWLHIQTRREDQRTTTTIFTHNWE